MAATVISTDSHQWAIDTALAIREGRFRGIDWELVAEEIEGLARAERNALQSSLTLLMYHLLKMEYQPEPRSGSWERSIRNQRKAIEKLLLEMPSLKPFLGNPEFIETAYENALVEGTRENLPDSVLKQFPENCPYTAEMLLR